MKTEKTSTSKIIAAFTFMPGFAGITYLAIDIFTYNQDAGFKSLLYECIELCFSLGFIVGMALYIDAAFILSLIFALMSPRRNLKFYAFAATLPPALLLALAYLFDYPEMGKQTIPIVLSTKTLNLIFIICPIASLFSIIAARISFPRDIEPKDPYKIEQGIIFTDNKVIQHKLIENKDMLSFLKVLITFTLCPGFAGIAYLASQIILLNNFQGITIKDFREILIICIVFGFLFGLLYYITPAFILGLIYSSLRLKNNWKSIAFATIFSPFFLIFLNCTMKLLLKYDVTVPGLMHVEASQFIFVICPITAIATLISAWISFPE